MMTATLDTQVASTSTLPDGDQLGNDVLMSIGSKATKALLRDGGSSVKARKGTPPRVSFAPTAWTINGKVD